MKFKTKSLVFVPTNNPEIDRAFREAGNGDPEMYNEQYGEYLQYMGTVIAPTINYVLNMACPDYDVWHEYRHRAIPGTNERKYWQIPASYKFKTDLLNETVTFDHVMELTT
jgi:hypothetical protein